MAGIRRPITPADSGLPLVNGIEAASQSYKAGNPLIATSGTLLKAVLTSSALDPAQALVAIAHDDATGTTSANVAAIPIFPGRVFEVSFDKASDLGALTLAAAHQWAEFGMSVDADGVVYLDVDRTTTNALFRITEFVTPVGTTSSAADGIRVRGVFSLDQTAYEAS